MPAPLYPGLIRAQVVFEGPSGLPADRYVNTFHFEGTAGEGAYDDIFTMLQNFYDHTYAGHSLTYWLNEGLATIGRVRCYDLAEGDPRTPHIRGPISQNGAGGGGWMPAEVCVGLSFYTDKNEPRKRGRVYLGPLTTASVATIGLGQPDARVHPDFRGAIGQAASALVTAGQSTGKPKWCVLSPTHGGSAGLVTRGWVDDAFDIQRRRGSKASGRSVWYP